jgi:hypothetical protein
MAQYPGLAPENRQRSKTYIKPKNIYHNYNDYQNKSGEIAGRVIYIYIYIYIYVVNWIHL